MYTVTVEFYSCTIFIMINEGVKNYCNEDISLIENYDKALADKEQTWHCHHRKELTTSRKELIKLGEYYNRPANELIFLTPSEHSALHNKGKQTWMKGKHHSEESRKKISEAHKGKTLSEETKRKLSFASKGNKNMLGKHHSEEAKQKISIASKGKKMSEEAKQKISESLKGNKHALGKHHTEEAKRKISFTKKGHCWFNNGSINVRAKSCPEGFVKGRLKKLV